MFSKKFCAGVGSAVLCCGLAYAQTSTAPTPPTPAEMASHQVQRLTEFLSLSTEEQAEATTLYTAAETAVANDRSSMEAARAALVSAIESNDASAISSAATQIGTLMAQQQQAIATAEAGLYKVLNSDQQTKFKTLLSRGPGGFGPPGGPHGPGPGGPPPGQ